MGFYIYLNFILSLWQNFFFFFFVGRFFITIENVLTDFSCIIYGRMPWGSSIESVDVEFVYMELCLKETYTKNIAHPNIIIGY